MWAQAQVKRESRVVFVGAGVDHKLPNAASG